MRMSRRSVLGAAIAALSAMGGGRPSTEEAGPRRVRLSMPKLVCRAKTEGTEDEIYLILAGRTSQGRGIVGRIPQDHWDLNEKDPAKTEVNDIKLWEGEISPSAPVEFTLFLLESDDGPSDHSANLGRVAAELTTVGGTLIGVKADVEDLLSKAFPHAGNPSIEVKRLEGNMELFGMPTNIPRTSVSAGISLYETDDCPGVMGIRLTLDKQGRLNCDFAARARCQDRGWVEEKLAPDILAGAAAFLPPEFVERIKQQELRMLKSLALKPTRQFWCKGDGAFYRLFLRAELV